MVNAVAGELGYRVATLPATHDAMIILDAIARLYKFYDDNGCYSNRYGTILVVDNNSVDVLATVLTTLDGFGFRYPPAVFWLTAMDESSVYEATKTRLFGRVNYVQRIGPCTHAQVSELYRHMIPDGDPGELDAAWVTSATERVTMRMWEQCFTEAIKRKIGIRDALHRVLLPYDPPPHKGAGATHPSTSTGA